MSDADATLASDEATAEILAIPGALERIKRGSEQAREGLVIPLRELGDDAAEDLRSPR